MNSAFQHSVQQMLNKRGHGTGFRLATPKAGCSGFSYKVDYVDLQNAEDVIFESFGIKIVVDSESLPNLDGTEIDYVAINATDQGFEFHNPNVQNICGCGESFMLGEVEKDVRTIP